VVPGAAAWTGQVLMVFNGERGALYDPARNVWTATPDPPAPAPRASQASVWTGSDFITWGGTDATNTACVNTGLRYRPATNVWTPTATTGAPARRCYPRVAWSGTEMLIFGGNDELGVVADGARYNPVTDTWRSLSTSGALSPRANHAGVWTGSQFLIWGGNDARAVFNTGAAYDPAADTWTPFSVPLAVVGRFDVSAVWTGTEMIIWGGEGADLGAYPSYGLRFKP
jgi:N-acetylneuraminic acid mutarotase